MTDTNSCTKKIFSGIAKIVVFTLITGIAIIATAPTICDLEANLFLHKDSPVRTNYCKQIADAFGPFYDAFNVTIGIPYRITDNNSTLWSEKGNQPI